MLHRTKGIAPTPNEIADYVHRSTSWPSSRLAYRQYQTRVASVTHDTAIALANRAHRLRRPNLIDYYGQEPPPLQRYALAVCPDMRRYAPQGFMRRLRTF